MIPRWELSLSAILCLGLVGSIADLVSFPATGELDVVFPRNETYAVEAPFPFILGFQNAPVMLSYDMLVLWDISCEHLTLDGSSSFTEDNVSYDGSTTYFYINASDTTSILMEEYGDYFYYWNLNDRAIKNDTCVFSWSWSYTATCETLSDGDTEITIGGFKTRKGNVTFTLSVGGISPRDAIANYSGCATAGTAVKVAENLTFYSSDCPGLADDPKPAPTPCKLDVSGAASSLAKAIVTPTTSFTAYPTTTMTTTETESGSDSTETESASNSESSTTSSSDSSGSTGNANSSKGSGAQTQFSMVGSGVLTLFVAFVAGGAFLLV